MDNFVQQLWDTYDTLMIPANATTGQREETKRAFYAGAKGILETIRVIRNNAVAKGQMSSVQMAQAWQTNDAFIDKIHDELKQYRLKLGMSE